MLTYLRVKQNNSNKINKMVRILTIITRRHAEDLNPRNKMRKKFKYFRCQEISYQLD